MRLTLFALAPLGLQLCFTMLAMPIEAAEVSQTQLAAFQTIKRLHDELGIPEDYASKSGLPVQDPPRALVSIGEDIYGRAQQLTPEAAKAWAQMRAKAKRDGVSLLLVSAFRPPEYQARLLRRKLARGEGIEEALEAVAAPGHSEHQSGRAVDLTCAGCVVLETAFEHTETFKWLKQNAELFGFSLSYPRANPHGIMYEPWHWCHGRRGAP